MNKRRALWLEIVLLALLGPVGRSFAFTSSATVTIDVTIAASLSVSVNGAASSTAAAVVWSVSRASLTPVGLATATIRNDSGGLTERWALSTTTNTINTATVGGSSWTIVGSTLAAMGEDQVAVQAVIGSSNTAAGGCPANGSSDWNQDYAAPLTVNPQTYGTAVGAQSLFAATAGDTPLTGNGTALPDKPANNNRMLTGSQRALCWRVMAPASSTTPDTQNIQIVVTAQVP